MTRARTRTVVGALTVAVALGLSVAVSGCHARDRQRGDPVRTDAAERHGRVLRLDMPFGEARAALEAAGSLDISYMVGILPYRGVNDEPPPKGEEAWYRLPDGCRLFMAGDEGVAGSGGPILLRRLRIGDDRNGKLDWMQKAVFVDALDVDDHRNPHVLSREAATQP